MTTTLPSDPLALSDIEVLRMLEQELLIPETLRDSINSDIVLSCVRERIREIEVKHVEKGLTLGLFSGEMRANFLGPLRTEQEAVKVRLLSEPERAARENELYREGLARRNGYDPAAHWRAKQEEREAFLMDLAAQQAAHTSELEGRHRAYLRGGPAPGEEEDPPTGGLSSPAEDVVTTPTHREEIR